MDSAIAYEKNARAFLNRRDTSTIGHNIVSNWANRLSAKSKVLELACGGGYPITAELNEAGLNLWAIDSSKTLLAEFCARFPDIPVRCERVQESDFFNEKFDAVIAIGLIFLLPDIDQEALFKKVSRVLPMKGRFLFTAPIETGRWNDLNTGLECYSLGIEGYQELLKKYGFNIIANVVDKGGNNYYDAEKVAHEA